MTDTGGPTPLTGIRHHAYAAVATASMTIATVSLVAALTLTGYALAHGAWDLENISRLSSEKLQRMAALDSLVWAPGLYIICWLSLLDGTARRRNIALTALLAALIALDALDDYAISGIEVNQSEVLFGFDLAVNGLLMLTAWLFVRRWPFKLTRELADSADVWFYRIPGLKSYAVWALNSVSLPLSLLALSNGSSIIAQLHLSDFSGLGTGLNFAGLFITSAHLLMSLNMSFVAGKAEDRRAIYWVLLAIIAYAVYSGSEAIGQYAHRLYAFDLNTVYITFEFGSYLTILICMFIGSVFSNIMSPAPLVRSTFIISAFVIVAGLLVAEFNNYVLGAISAVLSLSVAAKSIVTAAAVFLFALAMRQTDKALSSILPDE